MRASPILKDFEMTYWTSQKIQLLRKYWTEGHSASVIAIKLGDTTRNAVLGKVHRLGFHKEAPRKTSLEDHHKKEKILRKKSAVKKEPVQATVPQPIPTQPPKKAEPTKPNKDAFEPLEGIESVSFLGIENHHCRWPVGKDGGANQLFCGAEKIAGSSYCEQHQEKSVSNFQAWKRRNKGAIWK